MTETAWTDLEEAAASLVGQRCWHAFLPNGEDLQLEIGEVVEVEGSERHATIGSWGLIVDRGEWEILNDNHQSVASARDEAPTDDTLKTIEDEIAAVDVQHDDLSLTLRFRSGSELRVHTDGLESEDIAWELFAPDHMMFVAGPARELRYIRSDK
jgi:uncharacterized protein DUF6188